MRGALTALVGLAALGIAAGLGGRVWPVLDLIAAFRPHLGILAAALAGVAAFRRHWSMAGFAAGAAILAGASLGPALAPVSGAAAVPEGGRSLSVLYGNVRDDNPAVGLLGERLVAAGADVLVTSETPRALAGRLTGHYPHRLISGSDGMNRRTAVWSRFPLRDTRLHLNNTVAPTAASAVLDLGGGVTVGLVGVHFSRPTEAVQPRQVTGLGEIAGGLPRPRVVIGDFNAVPWSAMVARAARVTGTRVAGGYRVTWRGAYRTPLGALPEPWGHQIDQVLVSEGVAIEAVEALPLPGSDHRGLLVRLRLPAP